MYATLHAEKRKRAGIRNKGTRTRAKREKKSAAASAEVTLKMTKCQRKETAGKM